MEQELLTVMELAEKLKVPKSWIYAHTRQRGPDAIPKFRLGRYLRFHLGEVMQWVSNQQKSN
jgi:excisionase family DNA binding protein